MQEISFYKMHALGNDFVIINGLQEKIAVSPLSIAQLSNRHTGIGFDQLLIIEPSQKADIVCRIYNADGSLAEQCGNGLRCVARLMHEKKWHPHTEISIETIGGIFKANLADYTHIRISMNKPVMKAGFTHLTLDNAPLALEQYIFAALKNQASVPVSIISMGNPHTIIRVTSLDDEVIKLAPSIAMHTSFPNGTNVGFMQVINAEHIRLRTVERGVGETYACGSNACAAAATGMLHGWLKRKVEVEFKAGSVWVEWPQNEVEMHLIGPASHVFSGVIAIGDDNSVLSQ